MINIMDEKINPVKDTQIVPNRKGLKAVSSINIDSQFLTTVGNKLFSYQGTDTVWYQSISAEVLEINNDIKEATEIINSCIPVL